jgi:predicted regulator of Ras-like GTPase activity (Roadblock/LC7/MglB family)
MRLAVAATWVEVPLKRFVEEARVQVAVLLHPSGQVLGQFGFARSMDVMTACALSAAINASSAELGRLLEGKPFSGVHYAGKSRQIYLATVPIAGGALVLLTVFDDESSLGLVQLYFREFCAQVAAAAPPASADAPALGGDFERELNRNLAVMFGRA